MQIIDNITGLAILTETIQKNIRHIDYLRTIEIADDYRTYVTGAGIGKKLKQFNPRENDEMFEQRKRLTQAITPDIANSIMNPMQKVGRTPATIRIEWDKAQESDIKLNELYDVANKFYGHENVNDYLSTRLPELDSTDPNSFIVVEFSEVVNPLDPNSLKANPYPFEVTSREAINYKYQNNSLKYLVVDNAFNGLDDKGKEIILHKYTMYLSTVSIVATEIHKKDIELAVTELNLLPIDGYLETGINSNNNYFYKTVNRNKKEERYFYVQQFEHNIGFIPAFRVGSRHDLVTDGRTRVPLMHPAQPYFEKSIKTMSEFDLTNALHAFPQKIQYTDACVGEGSGDTLMGCFNGLTPTGGKCKACNGSGFKYHQSSQDMIQIRMPKDLKEMVSLENIIVYKSPPIDLLKFQKDYGLYELRNAAQTAVYNSEVFAKQEVQQTATGKIIDLDAVYDTLQPFAKRYSTIWTGIIYAIASLRDISEGLIVSHKFPNDFKMKPMSQLLQDLVTANQNNASSYIKNAITNDITRKIYIDQPREILRIETKNKYFPFSGKSEPEIQFIITNDLSDNHNKVLYVFFDKIFKDIEYEQGLKNIDFYHTSETMQREILNAKVQEYIAKIDNESFNSSAQAFGSIENEPLIIE